MFQLSKAQGRTIDIIHLHLLAAKTKIHQY